MKPHILMLLGLTVASTACEDISSSDLLTSGMSAVVYGTAEGEDSTRVMVELRAGGRLSNTMVDLQGDDELVATSGEQSVTLQKQSLGDYHNYVGNLTGGEEDMAVNVALLRTVDQGAPASTFTLPAPFAFDTSGDAISPTQNLAFTWSPANTNDDMEVVIDGDCILPWSKELDGDPGSFEIPGEEIEPVGEQGESCSVEVKLRRVRGGQLDAAFEEGGLVQGRQLRTFEATWSDGA